MDQFPPIVNYINEILPKKEPLVVVKWSVEVVIHTCAYNSSYKLYFIREVDDLDVNFS